MKPDEDEVIEILFDLTDSETQRHFWTHPDPSYEMSPNDLLDEVRRLIVKEFMDTQDDEIKNKWNNLLSIISDPFFRVENMPLVPFILDHPKWIEMTRAAKDLEKKLRERYKK